MEKLEIETKKPDFWKDQKKAVKIEKQISDLKEQISIFEPLEKELKEIKEFFAILDKKDEKVQEEIEQKIAGLEQKINKESLKIYLSGPYDKGDAILQVFAGAGGRDAQDWATMLLRMYQRYCAYQGWKTKILEQSFGEPGGPEGRIGTKSATLEIKGKYVFGFLKNESGVHRLVRISPFSPQDLRHTSFVQIVVLPKLETSQDLEVEIRAEDLKIETFRSSGPGGQYMQKTESAVRITHLPTNIVVRCQSERSQAQNKKKAMEILYGRFYQLKQQDLQKKVKKIKGEVDASWGRQIRNYVLHPYKSVKDLRTGIEMSNVEAALGGDLDEFIEAEIKL